MSEEDKPATKLHAKSAYIELKVKDIRKVLNQYIDDVSEYNSELDKNRLGKVLTIIDGAIADETQRKAIKDLVNDAWHNARPRYGKFYDGCPNMWQVADALGFQLHDPLVVPEAIPVREYNPYTKLVKE